MTLDLPLALAPKMAAVGRIFSLPICTTLSECSVILVAEKSKIVSSLKDLKFLYLNWISISSLLLNTVYTVFLKNQHPNEKKSQYDVDFSVIILYNTAKVRKCHAPR